MFTVTFLIGRMFARLKPLDFLNLEKDFQWYEYFWIGTFIIFAILQIWSIFLPVNIYPLILFTVLAIISLIITKKNRFRVDLKMSPTFIITLAIGLLVLSYYASQPIGMADTQGYHLNAVKWTNLYPTVPGLANLHSRLGFNTSFFPFASMLNNLFLQNKVSHIALSFFFAVLFAEFLWIFLKSKNRELKIFCMFVVPTVFAGVIKWRLLPSLYYDYVVMIMVLAAAVELIKGKLSTLFVAVLLSILLASVKLSGISFSALIIVFAIYKSFRISGTKGVKHLLLFLIAGLFIVIPYLVRNAILSGWLLYPLPIFRMDFDWTVPEEQVKSTYLTIKAWARLPGAGYVNYFYSGFMDWFPLWFVRNLGMLELKLLIFTLGLVALLPKTIKKEEFKKYGNLMYLLAISLVSVLYLLFTAPDFRFGGIFVWTFFAAATTLFALQFKWSESIKFTLIAAFIVFTFFVSWPPKFDTEPYLKSLRWDVPLPTKDVNGILMPTEESCGNSDLPCTPEDNNIKFRVTGDLSKGFAPVR